MLLSNRGFLLEIMRTRKKTQEYAALFLFYCFGIAYHTISYHIISYHTISYHVILYHTISYHIIPYYSIV
jgi:hypothetical protein